MPRVKAVITSNSEMVTEGMRLKNIPIITEPVDTKETTNSVNEAIMKNR